MSVLRTLAEIKATSGAKKKEALLTTALTENYESMFLTLWLALDPRVRFSVILPSAPLMEHCTGRMTLESFYDNIAQHEYSFTTNEEKDLLNNWIQSLSFEDAQVATSVINKDLNIGVGVKTVNKVLRKLDKPTIRVLDPMKAYKEKDTDLPPVPFKLDVKVDAARAFLVIDTEKNSSYFLTATANVIDTFTHLTEPAIAALAHLHGPSKVVIDGELVCLDSDGNNMPRQASNGLLNSAIAGKLPFEKAEKFVFVVWDFLPSESDDAEEPLYAGCYSPPAHTRQAMLEEFVETFNTISAHPDGIRMVESVIVNSVEEAYQITNEWIARGEEGAVAKSMNAPYEPKRSKHLVKIKKNAMADVRITGVNEGKNPGTLGSLSYETDDGLIKGDVSGIKDDLKKSIWSNPEAYIGRLIEVRYMEVTTDKKTGEYTLYGPPVFIRFREDKTDTSTFEQLS